jgi:glycosyltransferase involved in cell wall biosynthesis
MPRPPVDPPRLSVVVPAFNSAATVVETMASIMVQGPAVERVVVVDDGSTDATAAVVAEFAAAHPSPPVDLVSQPNRGLPGARNRGLDRAASPWVLFVDADDVLPDGFVSEMFTALGRADAATFAYCDFRDFGAVEGLRRVPEFDPERLKRGNYVGASTMFATETLVSVRYDERMRFGYEDWDLALRLVARGHVGVRADTALGYRRHASSMSVGLNAGWRARPRRWRLFAQLYRNNWRFLGLTWPLTLARRSWTARRRRPA